MTVKIHAWNRTSGRCINCGADVNDPALSGLCPGSATPSPYVAGNAPSRTPPAPPPPLTPAITPSIPTAGGWFVDLDAFGPPMPPPAPEPKRCLKCEREWCAVLDAYYGTEWPERDQCVDCRLGRKAGHEPIF